MKFKATIALALPLAVLLGACGGGDQGGTDKYPSTVTSVRVEGSVPNQNSPTTSAVKPQSCSPLPKPFNEIDACDAQAVAKTALATMYSTNPTVDASSQDAVLRAVPLLSTAMISRIAAPSQGGQQNTEWQNLKAARERVIATVTIKREGLSTYYQIDRKAVPVNADNNTPGRKLNSIAASPSLVVVDGMGYRLDAINPIS